MSLLYAGNLNPDDMKKFSQYAFYGDIYKCGDCGFVIEEMSHDTPEIIEYLSKEEYGEEIIDQLNLQEKADAYAPLVAIIEKHRAIGGANILDAGANTGVFLNLVRGLGANPFGLEPSLEATKVAKSRFDLDVQNDVIAGLDLPDESLDIITMWDVVEHLYDPLADLAALLPKLKRGGYIFVCTHNIENIFCRVLGKRNPLLLYAHFYHFSPETLSKALEKAGFEALGTRYFHKSWSLRYLLALFDEFWPNSIAAKCAGGAQKVISPFERVGNLRIRFPLNLFFVAIARRP